jgi:hypothetical protein
MNKDEFREKLLGAKTKIQLLDFFREEEQQYIEI